MTRPPDRADALVRITEFSAEDLAALVVDARPFLRPWMHWATDEYTVDTAAQFLAAAEAAWDDGTDYHFAIAPDGVPVGVCGLHAIIGPRGLEIGYWLHPDHTGRGHATRAAATLVDIASSLDHVDHVEIRHDVANHASRGIPERLGFAFLEEENRIVVAPLETGLGMVWRKEL